MRTIVRYERRFIYDQGYMIKETELLVEKTSSLVGLMLSGMGDGQELYDGKTIQIIIIVTQLARAKSSSDGRSENIRECRKTE